MRAFAPARIVSAATSTSPAAVPDGRRSVSERANEKLPAVEPTAFGAPRRARLRRRFRRQRATSTAPVNATRARSGARERARGCRRSGCHSGLGGERSRSFARGVRRGLRRAVCRLGVGRCGQEPTAQRGSVLGSTWFPVFTGLSAVSLIRMSWNRPAQISDSRAPERTDGRRAASRPRPRRGRSARTRCRSAGRRPPS